MLVCYCLISYFLVISQAHSADNKFSEQAKKLELLYNQLSYRRNNQKPAVDFIDTFPKTALEFNALFVDAEKSPLYDGSKYLLKLEYLIEDHPHKVLSLLLGLSSEVKMESNASQYLQLMLMKVCINYSEQFADYFSSASQKKQKAILRFMACCGEKSAVGYSDLIYLMNRTNHPNIAKQMQQTIKF